MNDGEQTRATKLQNFRVEASRILAEYEEMLAGIKQLNAEGEEPPLTPDDTPEVLSIMRRRATFERLVRQVKDAIESSASLDWPDGSG